MYDVFLDCVRTYTQYPDMNLFHMHTHDFYEVYCFLKGNAKYFVEGNVYHLKYGDILFIKKAEAHSLQITSPEPYERIVINFNAAAVLNEDIKNILEELDKMPLGKNNQFSYSVFKDMNWMYYIDKMVESKSTATQRLYLSVLINELYEHRSGASKNSAETDSFMDMIAYINSHLTESMDLDDICNKFYISKSQLNRKFKRMTASTVWEYITAKRLVLAKELLQSGDTPMTVYRKCGFNEYSSFFRAYKTKFKAAPKDHCVKKLYVK